MIYGSDGQAVIDNNGDNMDTIMFFDQFKCGVNAEAGLQFGGGLDVFEVQCEYRAAHIFTINTMKFTPEICLAILTFKLVIYLNYVKNVTAVNKILHK